MIPFVFAVVLVYLMSLSEGCNSNWTYNVLQLNHITYIVRDRVVDVCIRLRCSYSARLGSARLVRARVTI